MIEVGQRNGQRKKETPSWDFGGKVDDLTAGSRAVGYFFKKTVLQ